MTRIVTATVCALLMLQPLPVLAGDGKYKGQGNRGAAAAGCPPGLAKKNPPCIPPGLAKKSAPYRIGDRITGDYRVLLYPDRYGLDRRRTYYTAGGFVYHVDPETRKVLNFIGALSALLN